jgi:hypothetical protein
MEDLIEASDALAAGWRERKKIIPRESDPAIRATRHAASFAVTLFIAGLVLMLLSSIYMSIQSSVAWGLGALFPLGILFFIVRALTPSGKHRRVRQAFEGNERCMDPITVEIDEAGFHHLSATWQCHVQWKSIRQSYSTTAFFLLTDDSPMAFVIPKRAFGDAGLQDQFDRLVREQLTRAGVPVY